MTTVPPWRSGRHPPGPGVCDRCGRPCPYSAVVPVDADGDPIPGDDLDAADEWLCETCVRSV